MAMRVRLLGLAAAISLCGASVQAAQIASGDKVTFVQPRSDATGSLITRSGVVRFRWNVDALKNLGLRVISPSDDGPERTSRYAVRDEQGLAWGLYGIGLLPPTRGVLHMQGGPVLSDGKHEYSLANAELRVAHGRSRQFVLMSGDGELGFYADDWMYRWPEQGARVHVPTSELRITAELARALGAHLLSNSVVGELSFELIVDDIRSFAHPRTCGDPNWQGRPAPGGGVYQSDVFMSQLGATVARCLACDGPGGNAGTLVVTPDTTLINNVNNGMIVATIPGDPRGTSVAAHAADVPWYMKFSGTFPPYNNDQHPFLIWNLYRVDSNGAITQIGRSGLKHAFATSNDGPNCEGCNGNNVLGRACADQYPMSSNDATQLLGPRQEVVPALGIWGRCGSIYDPDCDGIQNAPPADPQQTNFRMLVRETDIDPAANVGSALHIEAWYVVREDIDIYNTMATRPIVINWHTPTGLPAQWQVGGLSPFRLGPAIDRWVDPDAPGPLARNVELATPEGRAKVAVKVQDLGGGSYRYDFAVMNFDFARAVTQGAEPNLRVLRARGFDRFEIARAADSNVASVGFTDGDASAANDWVSSVGAESIVWVAPDASASLDWGSMYRFSVVANQAPWNATVRLRVTEGGAPDSYTVASFSIGRIALFADSFE
jgi:hypothetical protein